MIIKNGNAIPLNANSGTLPNLDSALLDYFQPMTFTKISKLVNGFQVIETPTDITFQGVWQPLTPKEVSYKPEGQRAWSWYKVHADPSLTLEPDEVITYLEKQYRVKSRMDYTLYGYIEYSMIQDWEGEPL
jgi:hypothetical protein